MGYITSCAEGVGATALLVYFSLSGFGRAFTSGGETCTLVLQFRKKVCDE
jgi:hypothetical protein